MQEWIPSRLTDYAVLLAVAAALTLPNLGVPSLWDVDEGVNAEAAREMLEADGWIVPTFNFELRTAKPVMLYWLQRASYSAFGISEWSARFPSVLAGWLTILLTYELARRMFGRGTGLLAGVVLASAIEFCLLAHAATPDATLLLFTVLALCAFWIGQGNGSRKWWVPTAAACGLAMLTKGPVGVALPGLVIVLYFAWNRELRRLLDLRIVWGILAFAVVAGPWYGMVAAETRGAWVKAFFINENVKRALNPMENHGGPIFYHAAALLGLFAPWSIFLAGTLWYGFRSTRTPAVQAEPTALTASGASGAPLPSAERDEQRPHRFLICWFAAYLVFFSLVSTKLPNYILPLYPALAILTARFLARWREGSLPVPRWLMAGSAAALALVGVAVAFGLLAAGGVIPVFKRVAFPGLEQWAVLGLAPLAGALLMGRFLRRGQRTRFVQATAAAGVLFVGLLAAFPPGSMDRFKAPRGLVREGGLHDPSQDLRLATYDWFRPSLVFYAGREVEQLPSPEKVNEFLATPTPGYLFVAEPTWQSWLHVFVKGRTRVVASRFDFYSNCNVLLITNRPEPLSASR